MKAPMSFLREFSIGINFVEIAIEFAIMLYIFQDSRKSRLAASQFAILGFFTLALMRIFYIIFDYYDTYFTNPYIFQYIAWGFLYAGILLIVISLFKGVSRSIFSEFPHKKVYFIGFGSYIIFIVAVIRPLNSIIFYISSVGVAVFLLIPLILRFDKLLHKVGGFIKRYFGFSIIGLPLSFLGIGLGAIWKILPETEGWMLKIGAHSIFLLSLILLAVSLLSLPTLNEFDWEKTLSNLYILIPNGACVYSFNFKYLQSIAPQSMDPQLLGSGLTGIVMMVQEMTKSKKRLCFIKQECKNLYVEYGKQITAALIGEEELKVVYEKMKNFVYEFERVFPEISTWSYSQEEFKITNMIVRNIFAI